MSKFVGLRRRISKVHPSYPISGNSGNPQAGDDLGADVIPLGLLCRKRRYPSLAHRCDRGENPNIALVPNAQQAARRQLVVTESFSAKVPDGHAATKMEERIVRTDRNSAGVQVAKLRQYIGWQVGCHMLLNVLADRLRDPSPTPYRG